MVHKQLGYWHWHSMTIRSIFNSFMPIYLAYHCLLSSQAVNCAGILSPLQDVRDVRIVKHVQYRVDSNPLRLDMNEERVVGVNVALNRKEIPLANATSIQLTFEVTTISPQFNILRLNGSTLGQMKLIKDKSASSNAQDFDIYTNSFHLKAEYIGYAIIKPVSMKFESQYGSMSLNLADIKEHNLPVKIIKSQGAMEMVFIISVSIFIIITYINLGAQLDNENMKLLLKSPGPLILGSLISILVMPLIAWFLCKHFFKNQLIFRIGAFVFASGPAASASTLYSVLFDADKELSIGIQIISTIFALFTMPLLLYIMELLLEFEGSSSSSSLNSNELNHFETIKVPYVKLIQTLLVLSVALLIGWQFIGKNQRAQKISSKIFRPMTFIVLLFIIIFSSSLYWYIYTMFDWTVVLAAISITLVTYLTSGLLGHLIGCNKDHSIAISIGSTYKNSGIAFAVLVLAFEAPDTYIAFVPCLMQVLATSATLYILLLLMKLINCFRRIGQPNVIQATTSDLESATQGAPSKSVRSNSEVGSSSVKGMAAADDNEELVAMNVTDIVPGSPSSTKAKEVVRDDSITTTQVYNETTVSNERGPEC